EYVRSQCAESSQSCTASQYSGLAALRPNNRSLWWPLFGAGRQSGRQPPDQRKPCPEFLKHPHGRMHECGRDAIDSHMKRRTPDEKSDLQFDVGVWMCGCTAAPGW